MVTAAPRAARRPASDRRRWREPSRGIPRARQKEPWPETSSFFAPLERGPPNDERAYSPHTIQPSARSAPPHFLHAPRDAEEHEPRAPRNASRRRAEGGA